MSIIDVVSSAIFVTISELIDPSLLLWRVAGGCAQICVIEYWVFSNSIFDPFDCYWAIDSTWFYDYYNDFYGFYGSKLGISY